MKCKYKYKYKYKYRSAVYNDDSVQVEENRANSWEDKTWWKWNMKVGTILMLIAEGQKKWVKWNRFE